MTADPFSGVTTTSTEMMPTKSVPRTFTVWSVGEPKGSCTTTGPESIAMDLLMGSTFGPYYFVFLITVLVLATPVFARLPHALLIALLLLLVSSQIFGVTQAGLAEVTDTKLFLSKWALRDPRLHSSHAARASWC